ncbi:RNA polymerase III subunit Rpc25 [Thecamonas trahens ATCC 50062]|uniref:RNA polymerase III subunit Rpc25 n=1 Tax=Thecamonas trahens ATCC 50062 TaxID=461836 RepID=A0A0L0DGH3_THETB|nr:RNA polymerase III subunit Rpc25 [Thecamonas trahens ATCC 50062]KNC51290.1 RNA polymerase III subunit Rpc25 [Thecamonas trahens ATCC 50062]|eukprot:XP_013756214.1 RNA polymerase III subunit Rpc25 [Thecamonas trahens ATCC 50062]
MFLLHELDAQVKVQAHLLKRNTEEAIVRQLGKMYCDTVVGGVGLVVSIHDLVTVAEGMIHPGGGEVYFNVVFRAHVFRGVLGEIMYGEVKAASPAGLQIDLTFFDAVFVTPDLLPQPAVWNEESETWAWHYAVPGADEPQVLDIAVGETVTFKIIDEAFFDIHRADVSDDARPPHVDEHGKDVSAATAHKRPYCLLVSLNGNGLGLGEWWS